MDGPSQGKNDDKGQSINFRTSVVPKDEDDVFISSPVEGVPVLLLTICSNKDVDVIELFMNLSKLSKMACSLTVSNIQ